MPSLKMLGVGHSEAVEHWNTNALLQVNDRCLLIDAGYTIKYALRDSGLTLADIDAVFITHVHADHCFGLERLAYETRFRYGFKPTLYLPPGVYEELWDQTLKGVMGQVGEGPAELSDFFDVVIVDEQGFDFEGVRFSLFQNQHTPRKPSYGLFINERLMYSGDTRAIPEVVERLQPQLIIHDVTLTDWNPVHASVRELCDSYGAEVRSRMYLVSYEDSFEQSRTLVEQEFAGFAYQGQEFEI